MPNTETVQGPSLFVLASQQYPDACAVVEQAGARDLRRHVPVEPVTNTGAADGSVGTLDSEVIASTFRPLGSVARVSSGRRHEPASGNSARKLMPNARPRTQRSMEESFFSSV